MAKPQFHSALAGDTGRCNLQKCELESGIVFCDKGNQLPRHFLHTLHAAFRGHNF